ncbi:putative proteasome subunit beta type-3 [Cucumispora dikerogammari]|nr:putative proteasome subunit beta type-3 [Cucumispora dikerogammari]
MSDITTHYGGSLLALKGKTSLLIISDTRLGNGALTINKSFSKIYPLSENIFMGLTGFTPDCQHLHRLIRKYYNLHKLESRALSVKEVSNLVSYTLYNNYRWSPLYTNPIICGYTPEEGISIYNMDCIGSLNEVEFSASGTAEKSLIGLTETLYKEQMTNEELWKVGMQIWINCINRDCLSGMKAECFMMDAESGVVVKRKVRGRMD